MTIHELAKIPENATDKQNPDHAFCGQNYLHHYESHFESLRDRPVNLLEIGVNDGCSLRLWRDYFPKGQIHGLDINPKCVDHCAERIDVLWGDQGDSRVLEIVAMHGPFDIIIDDGSHYVPHILMAFSFLWPHVKPGGFYVMEDMRISYSGVDLGWPGMVFNKLLGMNRRSEVDAVLLDRMKVMDNLEGDLAAIHLYPMLYFFEHV